MNEPDHPSSSPEVPWPTSGNRVSTPDTSAATGSQTPSPEAVDPIDRAVRAGHETIDRMADASATTVRRLGERMHGAEDALHAKSAELRDTRDEWVESMRSTVRSHPLAMVAAALALGLLIARVTR